MMLHLQGKECPVTVQMNWLPLFRMGQMVRFELVHLLFLGDLAPLRMMARQEDRIGMFPLSLGTLVKEELTVNVRKLSIVVCLVGACWVLDCLWYRKALLGCDLDGFLSLQSILIRRLAWVCALVMVK